MSYVSLDEFWQVAVASGLWEGHAWRAWQQEFLASCQEQGQAATAESAAQWLVRQKRMTSYQALRILDGKPGPFHFGEYRVLRPRPLWATHSRRFEAVHLSTNHRVLLHFWVGGDDPDGRLWQRVQAHAEDHRRVRHPHLDRLYHVFETEVQRIAVSQWPEGKTLADLIASRSRVAASQAASFAHQIAAGLGHLHALGLTHGGLNPHEVILQPGNHVCLLRAPWGRPRPGDLAHWNSQGLRPLADYAAPELMRPDGVVDHLTDIYALGCLLFVMLEGKPPFGGESVDEVMQQHATARILDLAEHRHVPAGLFEVLSFMMAKRREFRYQTANEAIDKLQPYLPAGTRATVPTSGPTESYYLSHREESSAAQPEHIRRELPPGDPASAPAPLPAVKPEKLEPAADVPAAFTIETVQVASARMVATSDRRGALPHRGRAWGPIGAVLAVALGISGLFFWWRSGAGQASRPEGAGTVSALPEVSGPSGGERVPAAVKQTSARTDQVGDVELIQDDGRTLWASPTAGQPLDLRFTPAGCQWFLAARPSLLHAHADGPAVWQAFGPDFAQWQLDWQRQTGLVFTELPSLLLALTPDASGNFSASWVLKLTSDQQAVAANGMELSDRQPDGVVGRLGTWSAWIPLDAPDHLVLGTAEQIAAIRDVPEPPLRRQLETLRLQTDADRALTLLFTPNFLAADGKELLSGSRSKLRDPLLDFLGRTTQAALVSAHLGRQFYLELAWWTEFDEQPLRVAADRRGQLVRLPEQVNDYLGRTAIHPYWQPLAIRYPMMIHFVAEQARVGVVDRRLAVLNAVAPAAAAHNLLLATQLAISSPAVVGDVAVEAKDGRGDTNSLEALLQSTTSLVVQQQSLEAVMAEFAEALRGEFNSVPLEIEIIGKDLQMEGITRNQQIRNVQLENQTVRAILTDLVRRANPVAVDDVRQAEQKLVWVVLPTAVKPTIAITTRSAAAQKGWQIPAEFVAGDQR